MQNSPSPDLKSVVERDMAGETVFGIRVAAWRSPIKKPADCPQEKWDGVFPHGAGHTYAEHWSTEGPGAERLFTEEDVRSLLLTQKDRLDKLTWQPIETAPKDGSEVILFLREPWARSQIAYWYEPWGNWQCGPLPESEDEVTGIGSLVATHWMPLPEPPALTGSHT